MTSRKASYIIRQTYQQIIALLTCCTAAHREQPITIIKEAYKTFISLVNATEPVEMTTTGGPALRLLNSNLLPCEARKGRYNCTTGS